MISKKCNDAILKMPTLPLLFSLERSVSFPGIGPGTAGERCTNCSDCLYNSSQTGQNSHQCELLDFSIVSRLWLYMITSVYKCKVQKLCTQHSSRSSLLLCLYKGRTEIKWKTFSYHRRPEGDLKNVRKRTKQTRVKLIKTVKKREKSDPVLI